MKSFILLFLLILCGCSKATYRDFGGIVCDSTGFKYQIVGKFQLSGGATYVVSGEYDRPKLVKIGMCN